MRKILFQMMLLIVIVGCAPKIKSITEYVKKEEDVLKNKVAEFDKRGNKVLVQKFRPQWHSTIRKIEYNNGKKVKETTCLLLEEEDTCETIMFTFYEYQPKDNFKKRTTMFATDSTVISISKHYRINNLEVIHVNSWEMNPTKVPDPETAIKLLDSVFYDAKGREIIRLNYHVHADWQDRYVEKYEYFSDGYTREVSGTYNDTTQFHQYSIPEKIALKNGIDFEFRDTTDYEYKITYY